MKTTTEHLRVIMPDSFSNIDTVCLDGKFVEKSRKLIETIEEAKIAIQHVSESSSNSEYSEYWKNISLKCKVVKVTTIIEDIEL